MNFKIIRGPRWKLEKGSNLVVVAIFSGALFAMAALSIDVGNVYLQRAHIQEAGDSAALAAIKDWAKGTASSSVQQIGKNFAISNGILTNEIVSITVGKWDNTSRSFVAKDPLDSTDVPAVEVQARRTVDLALAGVIGMRQMNPRTTSVAIAARANGGIGVLPWAACINGVSPLPTKCESVDLQNGNDCSGPGNFGAISLGGTGANVYKANIVSGYPGVVHVGDIVPTEPGEMVGPTKKGLDDRLANAPPYNCTSTSAPPNNGRYAIVPVTGALGNGRNSVEILGFWVFALDDPQGGKVTGKFIEAFSGTEVDPTKPPAMGLLNGVALVK